MKRILIVCLCFICAMSAFAVVRTGLSVEYIVPFENFQDSSYDDTLLDLETWNFGAFVNYSEFLLGADCKVAYNGNFVDASRLKAQVFGMLNLPIYMVTLKAGLGMEVGYDLMNQQFINGGFTNSYELKTKCAINVDIKNLSIELGVHTPFSVIRNYTDFNNVLNNSNFTIGIGYLFPMRKLIYM